MNLQTIPHHSYEKGLPQEGNFILGQKRDDNIFVYQAFNNQIADYAVKNQKFGGPNYNFHRMTWIKPNFLWMMYRSGWAAKDLNQTRILAIEITFEGFEALLTHGVLTTCSQSHRDHQVWQEQLNKSEVRIQWDPDHDFKGNKLKRRAVQIGIKGNALQTYNDRYIRSIQDITSFVKEEKEQIDKGSDNFFVINECVIDVNESLKKKLAIPETFFSPFVEEMLQEFDTTGAVKLEKFERLLIDNSQSERDQFVTYLKNYQNREFSRYLLKLAIAYRKGESGKGNCMCEDLLMFSYFASKNKESTDLELIMEAKLADFDTWCGFDGELVYYPLGLEGTIAYLKANLEKFGQETVDKITASVPVGSLDRGIRSRAFWYL